MLLPAPSAHSAHWALDPKVCFLNHGSFGATPRAVLASQDRLRAQMEAEPIRFFVEEFDDLMDISRRALADFVGCNWTDIAPILNATVAVATVVESLVDSGYIAPGDEILINEHEYPACQNNIRRAARRAGAHVLTSSIPFPCPTPAAAAEAILSKVTSKTRLVLVSHVTSPSGLILPVRSIVEELNGRGILSLVDGAHAPGMVPDLDITSLKPSFYTANCHKWICSPKGSAFLYVREDLQRDIRPLALSNNAEKPKPGRPQFLTEFDFQGTADYTSFMSIPAAISFMNALLPGGFAAVMKHNHELCISGRNLICNKLSITPPAPDEMIGSISTMILPDWMGPVPQRITKYHDATQDDLLHRYGIQVPLWGIPTSPARYMRISAQLYNTLEQYEYLASCLLDLHKSLAPPNAFRL